MPIMPGPIVKEARWSGSQRFAECSLAIMTEGKTGIIPRSKHHDLTEKTRCVFQRCLSRLPPANTPSDGSELVRIPFHCQWAFHNYNRIANRGINVELSSYCSRWVGHQEAIMLTDAGSHVEQPDVHIPDLMRAAATPVGVASVPDARSTAGEHLLLGIGRPRQRARPPAGPIGRSLQPYGC
jgi:hypothetical protein